MSRRIGTPSLSRGEEEDTVTSSASPQDGGRFDTQEFAEELAAAPSNREIGTARWFENDHIRVFEVALDPGERCPFHCHQQTYFWSVVEGGRGLQRFADGAYVVRDYRVGDTSYLEHTPEAPLLHDLENIGPSRLRFVTVELHH